MDKTKDYFDHIVRIIYKILPAAKIYLFGSRVRKQHKEGADDGYRHIGMQYLKI